MDNLVWLDGWQIVAVLSRPEVNTTILEVDYQDRGCPCPARLDKSAAIRCNKCVLVVL